MKKLMVLVAIMAMVSTASIAQFKYGGGLTLGTEMSVEGDLGIGVNLRGDYYFNEKWSLAPGFTFVFPSSNELYKYSAWQLNADAHYHFYESGDFKFYGLGGLNFTHEKIKFDGDKDPLGGLLSAFGDISENSIGLDLGGGVNYDKFYGELKYDSGFGQIGITVGILFGGE